MEYKSMKDLWSFSVNYHFAPLLIKCILQCMAEFLLKSIVSVIIFFDKLE